VRTVLLLLLWVVTCRAQEQLKTMPGYARYDRITRESTNAFKSGALSVTWGNNGAALEYSHDGKRYRYDIGARRTTEIIASTNGAASNTSPREYSRRRPSGGERPARGRQFTSAVSADGKHKAFYRDHNLWLGDTNGSNAVAITKDGSATARIKYGSASWVYGEELYQTTAIWWSSNSQKVAFYRFDESRVPDYYLALHELSLQDTLDVEPYVKAGGTNPVVGILVYDLSTQKTTTVDVRSGKPFSDDSVGHYIYGISWTRDSRELLFHRTNRRQNVMELCAADPDSGECRVIVREQWLPSWTENLPEMRFLSDGRRFIWSSERTGWKNFYLYDLSGELLATLTKHPFEAADIVRVDEARRLLYYTARDGDNPMKLQLHRVGLNGAGDCRLTDRAFHHTIDLAPDGEHFVDIVQTHEVPPVTRLMDADGGLVEELARSDTNKFTRLGLRTVELIEFKAADGQTDLYGMLHKPSNFNPHHKYPLLVSVYAGPATTGARETFTLPNAWTELGFLVASFDSRSASGRGKRALDSIYERLGHVEIDDQAAGVKAVAARPYVEASRVGVFGTSYGGTASALCLLRYPQVFRAACASSGVMDFRNYDSIYTERYLWLPQENKAAYDNVNPISYVTNLTGRLLVYYGTADDNVHPSNSLQLINALQRARKSFEVQVGPDKGHTSVDSDRMMEFFIANLILPR